MRKAAAIGIMLALAVLATISSVQAAGTFWGTKQGTVIQNFKEISPDVSKSRCDSVTGTKAVFKTYTTAGWYAIELDVVDSTGAPVKGKLKLNGKQVAIGSSPFKLSNANGTAHSTVSFQPYSAAPRTLDLCIRRN